MIGQNIIQYIFNLDKMNFEIFKLLNDPLNSLKDIDEIKLKLNFENTKELYLRLEKMCIDNILVKNGNKYCINSDKNIDILNSNINEIDKVKNKIYNIQIWENLGFKDIRDNKGFGILVGELSNHLDSISNGNVILIQYKLSTLQSISMSDMNFEYFNSLKNALTKKISINLYFSDSQYNRLINGGVGEEEKSKIKEIINNLLELKSIGETFKCYTYDGNQYSFFEKLKIGIIDSERLLKVFLSVSSRDNDNRSVGYTSENQDFNNFINCIISTLVTNELVEDDWNQLKNTLGDK